MFNENWYTDSQLDKLKHLYESVRHLEGNIIEIGCWEGKSTIGLANQCFPETLICNDTWLGNIQESIVTGSPHPTELILKERDVYSIFLINMESNTRKNYTVVKEDCIEWLTRFEGNIKFIHIDASHDYESVFNTIQLVLPKMVQGGIICGDDYESANINRLDLHGGVERAVRECLPTHEHTSNLWHYVHT